MVSSGVWAGAIPLETAYNLTEVGSGTATQKSELSRIGYLGSLEASYRANPIGAHFELHIEQGPILESSNAKIGAVEGVQAYRWYTVTVRGRDCHTGTTDFRNRSDAMLTAAKLILHSHNKATELGCLASTGILSLKPGSTNTVPGFVQFSLDMRSREDEKLIELEKVLMSDFVRIAAGDDNGGLNTLGTKGRGCAVEWQMDTDSPATKFHEDCINCVEASAKDMLGVNAESQMQRMTSGAGHDRYEREIDVLDRMTDAQVVYIHRDGLRHQCKLSVPRTNLVTYQYYRIFVPCRDGVSHNPAEYCSPEDCANGAQVLLGAMLHYDRLRAERA